MQTIICSHDLYLYDMVERALAGRKKKQHTERHTHNKCWFEITLTSVCRQNVAMLSLNCIAQISDSTRRLIEMVQQIKVLLEREAKKKQQQPTERVETKAEKSCRTVSIFNIIEKQSHEHQIVNVIAITFSSDRSFNTVTVASFDCF